MKSKKPEISRQALLSILEDQEITLKELKKSQEHYKTLFNLSPTGIIILDTGGNIYDVNDEFIKLTGYKKNELLGKNVSIFSKGDAKKNIKKNIKRILSGEILEQVVTDIKKDGKEIIFELREKAITLPNGKQGILTIGRDITEQKMKEQALIESEKKFKHLTEYANASIGIIDKENFLYVNRAFTKATGYSTDEIMKMKFLDIVHPDHKTFAKQNSSARLREKNIPHRYDLKMITKKGQTKWMDFSAVKISFFDKPAILCTAIDNTDKKISELALKESEEKFRTLTEYTNSGIFIAQGEKFIYVNKTFTKITGYKLKDLSNLNIWDIVHPDYKEIVKKRALSRQTGKKELNNYEFKLITKKGKEIWLDFSATVINYLGKPAVLGTGFDITEKKKVEISLKESEEKFRSLTESTNSGIFIVRGECFVYLNPALEKLLGYKQKEAKKMKFWEFIHPDHRQMVIDRSFARQNGKKVIPRYEFKIITKKGEIKWIDFFASKITFMGEPSILGTIFDITEKKNVEQKLHESLDRLEKSEHIASMGFLDWNLKTNNVYWSNEICRVFGTKHGGNYHSFESTVNLTHPDDREYILNNFKLAASGKKEINIDFRMITNTNRIIWVNAQAELIKDNNGKPIYLLGTVLDITKRKLAEDKLLEQFQKNEKILSTTMDGFILADSKGKVVDANNAYCKMMKYKKEELIGKNIEQLDVYLSKDEIEEKVKRFTKKGYDRFETVHKDKNGEMVDLDVSISLMGFGGEIYVAAFVRDIRERKKYENEILENQKQLRALASHLQSVREEERKLLARELHDELGQILTAAKIDLNLLEKSSTENKKEIKEITNLINEGLGSTKRMVSQLRPQLLQELGFLEAIKEMLTKFKQTTKLKTFFRSNVKDINLEIEQSLPLYRIVQESLTNIVKHSKSDTARVNIKTEDKELIITIKDNGLGFNLEQKNFGGFGLLGMKERLIPLNGDIKIKSKIGIGTTVTVKVPINN